MMVTYELRRLEKEYRERIQLESARVEREARRARILQGQSSQSEQISYVFTRSPRLPPG